MPERFRLSFTAASLLVPDMAQLASAVLDADGQWADLKPSLLSRNREKSNKREFTELVLRLKTLSQGELELLATGDLDDQRQMSLIAFGRSYVFFRQFLSEVVMRKLQVFDHQLGDMDYWSFFSSKELTHPELSQMADSTREKLRQVMFKAMEQGGLLDGVETKRVVVPLITSRVRALLEANSGRDAELLLDQTMRTMS